MFGGKLEKMKIFAYSHPDCSDDHQLGTPFTVMMNPENYNLETKVEFSTPQASGTSGAQPRFKLTPPQELSFDFLFDNTGIIDDKPRTDIAADIATFKEFLMGYEGEIHSPKFFKLVWGTTLLKGICTSLNIQYKLFNPDGAPIRAICKVLIREAKEEELRVIEQNDQSPDLTHYRIIKKGDTLPMMCYKIYGNSKYYLQVASANKLSNFRMLKEGDEIFFPPIEKVNSK